MKKLLLGLALLGMGAPANASPIYAPVPTNAYITYAGLDWAWGGACAYSGCFGMYWGDLSYQGTQGWALPTLAQLDLIPANFADLFVFDGANVPYGGVDPVSGANFTASSPPGDAACAAAWFNVSLPACDWSDGAAGEWAGRPGSDTINEQLYVRTAAAVPEPASLAVLGVGVLGLAAVFRRRRVTGGPAAG